MPESEITFAELLKTVGYTTGCIGKWDVSNRKYIEGRVPNDQGFDYYWGTLGANDSGAVKLFDNRKPIGVVLELSLLFNALSTTSNPFPRPTGIRGGASQMSQ